LVNNAKWSCIMFKNYLRTAFRNIQRYKGYSFINIIGLALGMASCILILLWARDELSTDRFHDRLDSLYTVRTVLHYGNEVSETSGSVPALAPALKAEYPEIVNAARVNNGQGQFVLANGERQYRELFQMADPEIFRIFTFPFVEGRVEDVFEDPRVLVLSERAAAKIFGSEPAVGKVLKVNDAEEFRVAGVMKNIPHNSSLQFDIWAPLENANRWNRPGYTGTWYNLAFNTYVETAPGTDIEAFNKKIFGRIHRENSVEKSEPVLYPFGKVYLEVWGRMASVRVFSLIALAILIIACINFMNLSTARSARRAKEVGLRKVVGARRTQVMRQFFGESLIFTFLSLGLGLMMVVLFLPVFRNFTAKPLPLNDLLDPVMILGILGVCLATGFLSGSYPALFLSSFRPVAVLKSGRLSGASGSVFRKVMVVLQFSLSVVLIIGSVVIFNQVRYIKHKSLGFDREHLLYIPIEGPLLESVVPLKNEILRFPGIRSATASSHSPTGIYNNGHGWDWDGRDPNVDPLVTYFGVDPDFLKTFQMELAQGESFLPVEGHAMTSVLINERFAGIMNLPSAVGARLAQPGRQLRVIGVVKDFHFTPVNREIGPVIIYYDPTYRSMQKYRFMFIRLNPGPVPDALAHIEKTVKSFNPGFPFSYRFLDDDYDQLYRSVEREMSIVRVFTYLAILISCLGLFGLAAFTAERRTKEIGIRKVLGASETGIVALLSKEYAKWVLAANVIAWPVAYFLMKSWLQDYHYRISLGLPLFLSAAVISVLIAQLTVSFQALKAARTDPVKSIRYE
ncbi:MAG: ABC transporter permease, partial [Candidatus Aminicenantes bacterium]|nr:ABC transporter permease [Candidatus Aminicenantes bacterium]